MLPESSGYPSHQTGSEYLRFYARLYGLSRSAARSVSAELLEAVALEERASSPISSYSRGMRQRLGIARALINDPPVVFLDEPTLGLDPAGQYQVLRLIRTIAKSREATVVLSTHLLPEVEEVCSKVVILNHGRVVASGSVGEVIRTALIEQSAELRVPLDLIRASPAGAQRLLGPHHRPDRRAARCVEACGGYAREYLRCWVQRRHERCPHSSHGSRDSSPPVRAGRCALVRCLPQDDQRGCCMTLQVAPAIGTRQDVRAREGQSGWLVVAEQECRDLWTSGRGLILLFLFSVLLSAVTYLTSTNLALNFLEQRESVNLVLQFAVAVGVLATLVVSADGISGERERGTLETLLVTPVSRRSIIAGKLIAALTLWFATFGISIPYLWVLGREVGILGQALALGFCVGTLLAIGLGSIGLLISAACNSNRTSIVASIFLLLILFAPTQLPSGLPQGGFFEVLLRANPVASGLTYISSLLVEGHSWTQDLSYLITPLLTAIIAGGALILAGPRLVRLTRGVNGG